MEWWQIGLVLLVVSAIFNTAHWVGIIRQDIARLDRKLTLVLKQMNYTVADEFPLLSDRVKELARENQKIPAIKLYREETGVGLKEAKDKVEAFMNSLPL